MRPVRRRTVSVLTAAGAVAIAALPALASPAAARETPRVTVSDSHPSWATRSAEVSQAPTSKTINARVYLSPRDAAALDAAVTAVSTPGSPLPPLHHSRPVPGEVRPDAAGGSSGRRMAAQRRAQSLGVAAERALFDRHGFGEERAEGVRHQALALSPGRGTYQAPAGSVTVPSNVGRYVLSVTGLDEAPATARPNVKQDLLPSQTQGRQKLAPSAFPRQGFHDAQPCSAFWGEKTANVTADGHTTLPDFWGRAPYYDVCGYPPAQLRTAYEVPTGLTGKGQTVAIIDAYQSPTLLSDANRFAKDSGDPQFGPGQFAVLGPARAFNDEAACDSVNTWYPEQSIDVEAVHALAPGANVLYVAGASCNGIDLLEAEVSVVDDNRASIVSISYGDVESNETTGQVQFDTYLFKQAALQGMGFYVASGDNGDNKFATGIKQVGSSSSNPYATAVGATSLAIGYHGQYKWETGWGTNVWTLSPNGKRWADPQFRYGGGGGFSSLFARPTYQNGVVPVGSSTGRAVPDVAMDGDPNTGMLLGLTQQFPNGVAYDEARAGGTSMSTPLFAAVQALTEEAQHTRLGFANPRIYALAGQQHAGTSSRPAAFRDVTAEHDGAAVVRADYVNGVSPANGLTYSVRSFDDDTSLQTTTGWDDVTGVGSPSPAYYTATGS